MKKFSLLFAFLLTLLGGTSAQSVTEGFEYATDGTTVITVNDDNMGLSNGWVVVGSGNYVGISTGTSKDLQLKSSSYVYEGTYSIGTQYSNSNTWLVCPVEVSGTMEFYARQYSSSKSMKVGLAMKDGDSFVISKSNFYTCSGLSSSYQKYTVELGDDPVYIAFQPSYAYFDNVTYTPYVKPSGPALVVKDYDTGQKLTSPASYNFGLATAGTIHYFLLTNPGTEDLTVSVSETGNFGATLSTTTVPAGGNSHVALTVTMPDATGSSEITITPASGSGIDPFVINVSGTVRDANKVYLDFADGQMPDGWTSVAIGSYTSYPWTANVGYVGISATGSSWEQAFTSPKLTFTVGETIMFESSRYASTSTNGYSTATVKVEYSTDGNTWTTIGSAFTGDTYESWTSHSVTIPTADAKYIRFSGWYIRLRNIYGGELPVEPKMVVTQPASLEFGAITNPTNKTFTIANTGLATLNGITVTSSNSAVFAVNNVPTSLDAGTSQDVTITMSPTTPGNHTSTITVSATGMEAVTFEVSGTVLPSGLSVIDFNDNALPSRWENTGWTFSDGAAYAAYHNPAYVMTTPKIVVEDGDLFVIKAKLRYSGTYYYVTINGSSDNGTTWTAYTKQLSSELNTTDFTSILLSDIPSTVNRLQFVGYYGYIDEIQGINYAPELSVTKESVAVSTPESYDFGECGTNATVTYNFANAGAGTINITNVAITGDGAAAYSTNWTASVAAPFDLTITRTYDATRTGAQDAVVTVTTTDGDFVINVTGTDKAANAPELAVSTNAIDFGGVTADAVETVTVTNNGTGSMTVDIYSNSSDFTVSPTTLTGIGAGESKTFDITFKYGTPYGVKNGQVLVQPTYDTNAAINITVTGKAKDPNVWSEDFSGNVMPTGWDAGANWSFDTGVAKATYAYGTTNYLTTPTLTVSAATDELTFDYTATANYVSVKIQMSKDGAAFADYQTISSLNNGDAGTYTITGLEPGDYQFRFANDDYELDNFEGFKLNLADHIATISSYTIPESSSYNVTMKEGRSFDATVTVKELRGVAEALTAKLYMGTEVIGTATGNVAANGEETLTITATPTTAAPEGAKMHIEVEWAGDVMKTEEVTRYVAALTYLTLDETSSDAITAGTYDNVTLKRTFIAGWNTVCLPFDITDVEAFFGAGAKAYEFDSYSSETGLNFKTVATLTASYPYIVYVATAISSDINLTDIEIASNNIDPWYTRKTDSSNKALYFRGTYAPMDAGTLTGKYGVTDEAKIAKGNASATMNGFRAYFELTDEAATARILFDGEDVTTGIDNLNVNNDLNEVYNLNGQKVQKAQKGLYIINGKKVVVK